MASTVFMMSCTALSHAFPATKFCAYASPRQPLKGLILKLNGSGWKGGFSWVVLERASPIHTCRQGFEPVTTVAAEGYKMKTHKASAKRFRVTGSGKIVRRRAGKQHLLAKKSTKRKNRLSQMTYVDRSDYDNVIGALPYLKVRRKVTF